MSTLSIPLAISLCRSSHEERGLKLGDNRLPNGDPGSLLSRGAWIEIPLHYVLSGVFQSLLSRGAWIEISLFLMLLASASSRSSHEERGLKWL